MLSICVEKYYKYFSNLFKCCLSSNLARVKYTDYLLFAYRENLRSINSTMKIIYFPTINLTPPQNFIYNDTKLYSTPKALYHNISRHEVNKGHPLETLPFEPRKQLVPGFTAISRNYKLPPLPNVKLSTFKFGIKRSFVHPL